LLLYGTEKGPSRLRQGTAAVLTAGWSGIEGLSFYPSDFESTAEFLDDFAPIPGASAECTIDELHAAIMESRSALVD
jgi:hypothetical protein